MKNSNYSILDSYIFLPFNTFQINLPKGINSSELKFEKDYNVLICLQIKKDLQVVLNEYLNIVSQWKIKKVKLENYFKKCHFLLVLVTQSCVAENGKTIESFSHKDSDIFIMFADEINSKYFFDK